MSATFEYVFDTPSYKGTAKINTDLFIGGKWVPSVDDSPKIEVVNPATGKVITSVAAASAKDIDLAVSAAQTAFKTSWGFKVPGVERGRMLSKLADLIEANLEEFAAWETLNTGKPFGLAKIADIASAISILRYFSGWADKIAGQTLETNEKKFAYTRHEPYGVVGQIIPWNFPLVMLAAKIGPALACGNTVVLKPSEVTPLTALRVAELITEAGFPPGVLNIVNGFGYTAGQAMAEHPEIRKISFTGSTVTGRRIQEAAAKSNLKAVTLELGGKSPNIIFDDADLDQAVKWAGQGIFANMGQVCVAGSRIFVQEGIYDEFTKKFANVAAGLQQLTGDPFADTTHHGPQISKVQYERVMGYISAGKEAGATVLVGGESHGSEGYFVQPTIFTDVRPDMTIVREEIFGPVAAVIKFKTEEEAIEMANDTSFGLASAVFTENLSRAIRVSNALEAGVAWVNCVLDSTINLPLGGYKESGIGIENGQYALDTYTQVKSVYINIGNKI